MEFSGRLATIQFGDVLQLAHQERWSGALVVRRTSREKRIFLHHGRVVGCLSDDPAEFFGRHLLLQGVLTEKELARALAWCSEHGRRLGEALRELELLSEDEVRASLASRIADAVCDLFLWDRGVFYLENDLPPDEALPPAPLDVFGLVMEGSRWLDEQRRIRSVLVSDKVVLRRGPRWPPAAGAAARQRLLAREVDGERDLGALHRGLGGVRFRFLEAAYALCLEEVLDIERVGGEDLSVTHELSLLDVLMEQASSDERTLLSERHFSMPVDLLVRLVPAWAGPRAGGDGGLPSADERFLAAIDGRTPIRDLLSTSAEARGRQLELLLVELRRGRLALLPAPVGEVRLQG
jgi:hypothetical protein